MCVTVRERAKKSKVERVREREIYIYILYTEGELLFVEASEAERKSGRVSSPLETETLKTIYPCRCSNEAARRK